LKSIEIISDFRITDGGKQEKSRVKT